MAKKKDSGKSSPAKPYTIEKKRSGRYAVRTETGYVNGVEKTKILVAEGLVKTGLPKAAPEEAPAAE